MITSYYDNVLVIPDNEAPRDALTILREAYDVLNAMMDTSFDTLDVYQVEALCDFTDTARLLLRSIEHLEGCAL